MNGVEKPVGALAPVPKALRAALETELDSVKTHVADTKWQLALATALDPRRTIAALRDPLVEDLVDDEGTKAL